MFEEAVIYHLDFRKWYHPVVNSRFQMMPQVYVNLPET